MSLLATYQPQRCAVTRPEMPDVWGAVAPATTVVVPCRYALAERQVTGPDGRQIASTAQVVVSGDVDVRVGDEVRLTDTLSGRVLSVLETRGLGGEVVERRAYLGTVTR